MPVIVGDHHQPGQLLRLPAPPPGCRSGGGPFGHLAGEDVAQRIEGGCDAPGRHGPVEKVGIMNVRQQVETSPVTRVLNGEGGRQFQVLGQLVGGELHDQRADHGDGAFARPDHRHHGGFPQVGGGRHRLDGGMGAGEHLGFAQQDRVDRLHGGFGGGDVQCEPRHRRHPDARLKVVGVGAASFPQPLGVVDEADDPGRARVQRQGGVAGVLGLFPQLVAGAFEVVEVATAVETQLLGGASPAGDGETETA